MFNPPPQLTVQEIEKLMGFTTPKGPATFPAEKSVYLLGNDYVQGMELDGKYIIWEPTNTTRPPRKVFADRPTAIKVAFGMAAKNPGQQFAVAKLVGVAATGGVSFNSFED